MRKEDKKDLVKKSVKTLGMLTLMIIPFLLTFLVSSTLISISTGVNYSYDVIDGVTHEKTYTRRYETIVGSSEVFCSRTVEKVDGEVVRDDLTNCGEDVSMYLIAFTTISLLFFCCMFAVVAVLIIRDIWIF